MRIFGVFAQREINGITSLNTSKSLPKVELDGNNRPFSCYFVSKADLALSKLSVAENKCLPKC